ncbi:hypothetical protein [Thiomicrorhabdus sp. 6S3-12]|uniref:hypothetical protein n=1 Tax=Thiomicrorhabdus sp. 6S3-12 TaxID=2819681 RepID=UPI001AACE088|nr:hypothetical protein [Thiomicrorhabdus sp. 6S3-12]MBO1923719.1 hypothetical protein [Thiomicrorhabdus sp. 6S3-12]
MKFLTSCATLLVASLVPIMGTAADPAPVQNVPQNVPQSADVIVLERGQDGKLKVRTETPTDQAETQKAAPEQKKPQISGAGNDVLNKPLNLQTILLDKPTREKIDRQRAAYINPPEAQDVEKIPPPPPPGKGTGTGKAKKKRIYLPYKLAVSALVIKPNGDSLARVNGKYNRTYSKHISINKEHTTEKGVAFDILGKEQVVPVGSTLLPRKPKVIPTYQLVQKEKAKGKALPKTKERVAKDTLEQVKILTSQPTATKPNSQ